MLPASAADAMVNLPSSVGCRIWSHNPSGFVTLLGLDVLRYFLNETMAFRDSPTDSVEEGLVSLSTLRVGSRISTGGRRRRAGEPEPDEESQRLRGDSQVTLNTFGLAGKRREGRRAQQ